MSSYLIIESDSLSIYKNLAIEEYLLEYVKEKNIKVLFLWQNKDCIVLGKHQNAYQECNIELLNQNQIDLARRITGGGAVFHDIGNLNFSIITSAQDYDRDKSMSLIQMALQSCGLITNLSGRNDILIDGKKISGNAYYKDAYIGLHHGTLLVDCNLDKMNALLNVDQDKMIRNGVKSIKSRVINLCDIEPRISVNMLKSAIKNMFLDIYTNELSRAVDITIADEDPMFQELYMKYKTKEWNYGLELPQLLLNRRAFSWGTVQIGYLIENHILTTIKIYTDYINSIFIKKMNAFLENQKIEDIMKYDFWEKNALVINEMDLVAQRDLFIFISELLLEEVRKEDTNGTI